MSKIKTLSTVVSVMLMAGIGFTAQAAGVADLHAKASLNCASCHDSSSPKAGATVSTEKCSSCHGSLTAISEQAKKKGTAQKPDPHVNHSIGLNCDECHKGHQESVNMCNRCHIFEYKMP